MKSSKGIKCKKKGNTRKGMDHNEYIKWAFKQINWNVTSNVKKLSATGTKIKDQNRLRAGDILFFNMSKKMSKTPNYMGIYKAKGKFACILPVKGKGFAIGPLSHKSFKKGYLFARRIYPKLMPK